MQKTKSLTLLLSLAVGALAMSACKLDRPTSSSNTTTDTDTQTQICTSTGIDAGTPIDVSPVVVVPTQCSGASATVKLPYTQGYTPASDDLAQVQKMLVQMTLEQKADQMRGRPYGSSGKTQMNDTQRSDDTPAVRGYRYRDASRGMNLAEDMDGVKPNAGTWFGTKVGYSTTFPASIARGAAFDLDLEYAIGEAIGDEMMAAGQTVLLAPCMNIIRHPAWGRTQETYSEDAYHMGRLASAMTIGIQQHIAANAKHWMAYDIEGGRDQNDMSLDEQTLREIYGRHFRMVVQDGGVASVMASYNMVNGTKSVENQHTLTDVMRKDFGFQGFILSDWWAMFPGVNVGTDVTTLKKYAINAINAGLDIELPWKLNYAFLEELVRSNAITQQQVETGAGRVLLQKLRFNSWDISKSSWGLGRPKTTYKKSRIVYSGCDGHVDLARKAAIEGMVLMKNANDKDGNATLPISKSVKKVAVLGATVPYTTTNDGKPTVATMNFATEVHTGDKGSSRVFSAPEDSIGPFDGIKLTRPSQDIVVETGTSPSDDKVKDADFFVVVAGLTPGDEGEDYTGASDRSSFGLDAKQKDAAYAGIQNKLIDAVIATGKPMVVVLEGGSVIDMPWLDRVPAVVMAWYGGMRVGEALGMLLWGQANFSAKLPLTWGRFSDYPPFKATTGATSADYFLGYRYFDKFGITPVFPFGYGLSYTTFAYSNLQLGCSSMSEGAVLPVYVDVKNTGTVAGDEIVMLFVSFPNSKAARRTTIKELKGFTRVSLNPGETKQVMIPVRLKDLDYYDQNSNKWVVEDGPITIMVGGNSTNFAPEMTGTVNVQGYAKDSSNY
jgi:beta-glucosidase